MAELSLPGCDAHGVLGYPGAAEVLEQENHFVFLILQGILATEYSIRSRTVAVAFKLLDRLGQLGTAASTLPAVFQDASAQELSDILQFVDGQTLQKAPG